jgi:hypothetical protein
MLYNRRSKEQAQGMHELQKQMTQQTIPDKTKFPPRKRKYKQDDGFE